MRSEIAEMMNNAWTESGFCVPNPETYPHQWLWDSCFHALIWGALDSGRGLTEVESALTAQDPDGFVPHMVFGRDPESQAQFWGRPATSCITQPPMYGHTIAELMRAGYKVPPELMARARAGLLNLFARPRTEGGLVPVFHPWETGCDDSARWDYFIDPATSDDADISDLERASSEDRVARWKLRKEQMVVGLERSEYGSAVGSSEFAVGSIGFNALLAWNAMELSLVFPGGEDLAQLALELSSAIADRWAGDRWVDDGPHQHTSGRVRTLDTMAALLVDPRVEGFEALVDPAAFGAPFGPRGVHLDEPSYQPDVYWRGPSWPQLGYLMVVAAERAEHPEAEVLAQWLVAGAERSGLAEYWNPETGEGLGARPQTWTGLALLMLG